MSWILLSFIFSFFGAILVGFNQWAKLEGSHLVVVRLVGIVPLALLTGLVVGMPTQPGFYAAAALMGVGLAYADTLLYGAAAVHGGRLTALYIPLKMLVAFALWAVVMPETLMPMLSEPWRLGVLTMGFGFCSGALLFLRRADASWQALAAVLPVAMLFAVGDVVAKAALGEVTAEHGLAQVVGRTVAFLLTTSTVGTLGALWLGKPFKPTRRELVMGGLFGAVFLVGLTVLLLAIALAPNPGYVAAITMLSALWLALHAAWARGEKNNWWAGVALLVGAIAVAVASAG